MNQYITVKGIYDKGNVHLLEIPEQIIAANSEVMVLIPIRKKKDKKPMGIAISNYNKKINLFSLGGDAVTDTEELFND
jgi:hypothetical protein